MGRPAEPTPNPPRQAPELPPSAPRRPRWLHRYGRAEWRRLVRLLEPLGYPTAADQQALACLCQAVAEMRLATEALEAEGRTVRTGGVCIEDAEGGTRWEGGQLQPHPAVAQQRSAWAAIRAFSALFGLDPASRGKLPAARRKAAGVAARKRT